MGASVRTKSSTTGLRVVIMSFHSLSRSAQNNTVIGRSVDDGPRFFRGCHHLIRARCESQQEPPGGGGAAGAAEPTACGPHEAGEAARSAIHQAGAITRKQRGSTRRVAGVAPIGSPSA